MIDTHAHIHDAKFDDDRDAMIERARHEGLTDIIVVATDLADAERAVALANAYGFAAAVGVHPHEAEHAPSDLSARLADIGARARRWAAIGEIGLDFHYDHSPRDVQVSVLREQLNLAARLDLPVIFHEREAIEVFVDELRIEVRRRADAALPALRGVVHCFTRDFDAAHVYTGEFGLKLGIGGVATFKSAESLREAIREVGLEHLILETDCPYLAPVPYRGKRNEPAFMTESARRIAELLDLPVEHVVAVTTRNAKATFKVLSSRESSPQS